MIFLWRTLCMLFTRVKHRRTWMSPALLLRYETPAQKSAYHQLNITTKADISRQVGKMSARLLVIIPFRDKWMMTEECLAALYRQEMGEMEILVALVDNGSIEEETAVGIQKVLSRTDRNCRVRHLRYDIPFNFSRLNNLAVEDCSDFHASQVCFLNNDVVMTDPSTLVQMAQFIALHPTAGTVGCSLLYPDQTIQHLFIAVGCKIVGAHPYKGGRINPKDAWYQSPRPVGAATAALVLMDRALFEQVGGFEEELPSCYQDVDLALKVQAVGRINWVLPWITAIHHETQTRSPVHSWEEVALMHMRWGKTLTCNPYHARSWSRWSEPMVLALGEGDYPWQWLRD